MATKKTKKTIKKKSFFKTLKKDLKKGYKVAKKAGKVGAKYGGKALDMADKITIGTEKARSNLYLGNVVTITNGPYSKKQLTITAFIVGGIEGKLSNGQLIRIRYGSYKTTKDPHPAYRNDSVPKKVPKKGDWVRGLERY